VRLVRRKADYPPNDWHNPLATCAARSKSGSCHLWAALGLKTLSYPRWRLIENWLDCYLRPIRSSVINLAESLLQCP
jgi:hypothetical protein